MKLTRVTFTLALLVSLQWSAQSGGQSQTASGTGGRVVKLPGTIAPGASLEGVVLSDETGAPLAGATVTLELTGQQANVLANLLNDGPPPPIAPVSTNASGRFSFPKVDAGPYVVTARRDGYVPQKVGEGKPLTLAGGQHISNVSFRLPRTARITGRIRSAAGQPAAEIPVLLFPSATLQSGPIPIAQTKSADDGSYRLDGFVPGQYAVAAGSLPRLLSSPATPTGSFAAQIAVPTTDVVTLNFSLDVGAGYNLRGRVREESSNVFPIAVEWNVVAIAPLAVAPYHPSSFTYNPQNGIFAVPGFRAGIYRIAVTGCGGAVVVVSNTDVTGLVLPKVVCR